MNKTFAILIVVFLVSLTGAMVIPYSFSIYHLFFLTWYIGFLVALITVLWSIFDFYVDIIKKRAEKEKVKYMIRLCLKEHYSSSLTVVVFLVLAILRFGGPDATMFFCFLAGIALIIPFFTIIIKIISSVSDI